MEEESNKSCYSYLTIENSIEFSNVHKNHLYKIFKQEKYLLNLDKNVSKCT